MCIRRNYGKCAFLPALNKLHDGDDDDDDDVDDDF